MSGRGHPRRNEQCEHPTNVSSGKPVNGVATDYLHSSPFGQKEVYTVTPLNASASL
jgi:hypothetical protein